MSDRVLVTGVSGFLGGHVALELLRKGYTVRGSVRSLDKADRVRETLAAHGADVSRLEFVALDLLSDEGWEAAMEGVRYVQHVASPFVIEQPRDRNELIRPAVEGARRAVTAAMGGGVERIVLTSSVAAIAYGHEREQQRTFTEADWSNLESPRITPYQESKTRAEQEAWRLAEGFGARERLAVINPGAILGPLLDDDPGTSGLIAIRLLNGSMPGTPRMSFSVIDVRDVAAAQVAAMTDPAAGGRRFILADREMTLQEMADAIQTGLKRPNVRTPRFELPNWLVRLVALFDRQIRDNTAELGRTRPVNGDAGRALLRRATIPGPEAVTATAESLFVHGLLKA
ncbi:aldehyde reductase [Devosia sp. ZB163]|uniref:SDR family oxidoreductase n=1 Tax=Devosia sp. ZB163 TaxID=3025938 RepID=UPI00235F7D63|nr:aldehyde reductase [Devosia sp. ZB163]MDC9822170.1 aldehyde reductase [Devosia sp. ZB163]